MMAIYLYIGIFTALVLVCVGICFAIRDSPDNVDLALNIGTIMIISPVLAIVWPGVIVAGLITLLAIRYRDRVQG